MACAERIESLKQRRLFLSHQIHAEESKLVPDEIRIKKLKHERLQMKDELQRLWHMREREAA
jgi:hypothetical protein